MQQVFTARLILRFVLLGAFAMGVCCGQSTGQQGDTLVSHPLRLADPVLELRADPEFERDLRSALSDTLDGATKTAAALRAIAVAENRLSKNHRLTALSVHAVACQDLLASQQSLNAALALQSEILDPRSLAWYYFARGLLMCRQRDWEQGAVALEQARKWLNDPVHAESRRFPFDGPNENEVSAWLACCYARLYDTANAGRIYGQLAISSDRETDRMAAAINQAEQYALAGEYAAAEESLRLVEWAMGSHSDILVAMLARFMLEMDQVELGRSLAEAGLLRAHCSPLPMRAKDDLLATLIKVMLRDGRTNEARQLVSKPTSLLLLRDLHAAGDLSPVAMENPFASYAPQASNVAALDSTAAVDNASDPAKDLDITRGITLFETGDKQQGIELIEAVANDEEAAPSLREEAYLTLADLARSEGNQQLVNEAQSALIQMLRDFRNSGDRVVRQSFEEAESQREQIARLKNEQQKMNFERIRAEQAAKLATQEIHFSKKLQLRSMVVAVVFGLALCMLLLVDRDRRIQTRLREKEEESNERLAIVLEEKSQALMRELEERVALEKSLERKRRDESIGQLTGNVAHDFNNLLQVILTTNEFLQKQIDLDSDQSKMLAISSKSAHIGASIVKQLLSYARQQTLAPSVVNLTDYLDGTSTLLRATVDQHCALYISDESHGASVVLDPTQLTTALMNLLKNAVDAMPQGGTINLRIFRQRIEQPASSGWKDVQAGEYIAFEVDDTGKGMSDDELTKAFEPFYTTKPPAAGTGLGLSSVYGFVKQSGGDVKIHNRPGAGICVSMIFPTSDETVAEDSVRGGSAGDMYCRMLLVEDNEEVGRSILTKVRSMGMEAELVTSGTAAIERLLHDDQFDLVLSDVRMPGEVDGVHLRGWIQEHKSELAVLLMSGYSDIDELPAGSIILQKPFTEMELLQAMSLELPKFEAVPEASYG